MHDDPEQRIEDKIDRIEKLAKGNQKILKRLQSHMRWASVMRILYWVVIVGAAFGAYYFLQPYIDAMIDAYNAVADGINKVREVGEKIPDLPDLGSIFGG